jgi:hypothetical protein
MTETYAIALLGPQLDGGDDVPSLEVNNEAFWHSLIPEETAAEFLDLKPRTLQDWRTLHQGINPPRRGNVSGGGRAMTKPPHEYASLFPMMKGEQFRQLVESIREDGLQEPVITYEGKVLDGRNRQLACANLGIHPTYKAYKGADPLAYVMRVNLVRRHLTTGQRAMVAAKLADMKVGSNQHKKEGPQICGPSTVQAAEQLGVSPRSVDNAKVVQASGDDELIDAVEKGEVTVSAAAAKVRPDKPDPDKWRKDFDRLMEKVTPKDLAWAKDVMRRDGALGGLRGRIDPGYWAGSGRKPHRKKPGAD